MYNEKVFEKINFRIKLTKVGQTQAVSQENRKIQFKNQFCVIFTLTNNDRLK